MKCNRSIPASAAVAFVAALGISSAVAGPLVMGATVAAVGTLEDSSGGAPDGTYDTLGPSTGLQLFGGAGFGEARRAMVVEFALPSAPVGATLTGASLRVDDFGGGNLDPQSFDVFMYAGDGSVALSDAGLGTKVGTKTTVDGRGGANGNGLDDPYDLMLSIPLAALNALLNGGASSVGFFVGPDRVLSSGSADYLALTDGSSRGISFRAPSLTLTYDAPSQVPEPGTLLLAVAGMTALVARMKRRQA